MHIYDSIGPNPRAVRMFLAEKKLDVPLQPINLLGGENRAAPYTTKNPGAQVPSLELDDGTVIGETVAIFEYLEELHPQPSLIGTTPKERAETRMWQRRIELRITENLYNGFRFAEGIDIFRDRMRCLPDAADGLKAIARDNLAWLDALLGDRPFIVDGRFTMVDIILYCALDFGIGVGQPIPADLPKVNAWYQRIASRPSATSSLHATSAQLGFRG